MSPARVVVGINVGEEFGSGVVGIDEAAALEHFVFEGSDEGLGPGIVIGIGPRRHALDRSGLFQQRPERPAAILAAAVAVKNESAPWST